MRHGRKSASQCFNGYKGALAVEPESQVITAVDVIPANKPDGVDAKALVNESSQTTGSVVDTVIGDGAYGTIEARLAAQEASPPYALVAPVTRPAEIGRFTKQDFQIDLAKMEIRCPAGKVTCTSTPRKDTKLSGRVILYRTFRFSERQCAHCRLRRRCLKDKSRFRTISIHEAEHLIQEAKTFQRTDDFHNVYRQRVVVEHRISRLMRFGLRRARYFGSAKVLFQLAMAAAVANLTLAAASGSIGLISVLLVASMLFLVTATRPRMSYRTLSWNVASSP